MRPLALLALLASCQAPDRWHTSVARGEADIDSHKIDFEEESTSIEVGISGPIGFTKKVSPPPPMPPYQPPQEPAGGGLPITELVLLLSGAGIWKGSEYGMAKYRSRRKA